MVVAFNTDTGEALYSATTADNNHHNELLNAIAGQAACILPGDAENSMYEGYFHDGSRACIREEMPIETSKDGPIQVNEEQRIKGVIKGSHVLLQRISSVILPEHQSILFDGECGENEICLKFAEPGRYSLTISKPPQYLNFAQEITVIA